jgi:hypothetical protein
MRLCGGFGGPEIIRPVGNFFLKTLFVRARVMSDLQFVIDIDASSSGRTRARPMSTSFPATSKKRNERQKAGDNRYTSRIPHFGPQEHVMWSGE